MNIYSLNEFHNYLIILANKVYNYLLHSLKESGQLGI